MTSRAIAGVAFAAVCLAAAPKPAAAQSTLAAIKQRGSVACGVNQSLAGFAFPLGGGRWSGMNVDFCRAIAAAVFDDPEKVTYQPVAIADMFAELKASKFDVLVRNVTWTSSREVEGQVAFGPVTFYDGQGFMVKKAQRVILSARGLGNVPVCVASGSTTELNINDYFRANGLQARLVVMPDWAQTVAAYESGKCQAISTDTSGLHALRATFGNADDHIILPQVISKEPLAPVVRQGDDQWLQIVRWTHFAMVTGEDLGISRATLAEQLKSSSPEVRRILGLEGRQGEILGLSNDWAQRVIRHVGNYGESFERNLGRGSPLRFNRGLNALWSQGGLQYAPPFR
ncbi:MAG: amino acid ABC transporter substrate-binding protein [Beijerinckiaceae bacterium]